MEQSHEKFKVSQWGALIRDGKCLIMRSRDKEVWELPGGRINVDELNSSTAEDAFRREINEELGITEFTIVSPVNWMIGYTTNGNFPICRLVYLIQNDKDEIKLSEEHKEFCWIGLDEIDNYAYSEFKNATKLSDIIKNAFEKNS